MRLAHLPVGLALALAAGSDARAAARTDAPAGARALAVFPEGVLVALARGLPPGEAPGDAGKGGGREDGGEQDASGPSLDFDLLGEPGPPPPPADTGPLRLRRRMLAAHQGIGLGLAALQLSTAVVGQLNYSDRFAGGPDTARYRLTHRLLAYSTLGVFAANGLVALLAPTAGRGPYRLDRVMLHRIAMAGAAIGMAAQAVLGVRTRDRTGYLDQERHARIHLAVGYATLALFAVGVGVLIF